MKLINRQRPVRVMMLGWEYPPRFAGGLGKACQGLAQAMARQGAQLFFVLPTFPERVVENRLEVIGAREVLIEAGWDLEATFGRMAQVRQTQGRLQGPLSGSVAAAAEAMEIAQQGPQPLSAETIRFIRSDARLFPYGAAPEGPISERLHHILAGGGEVGGYDMEAEVTGSIYDAHGATYQARRRLLRQKLQSGASFQARTADESARPGSKEIYGQNLWSEIERFCYTVRQLAEAHEVDLVHAHDWMTFPAAFEFQRKTGVPVFLHVHATEYDRSGENVHSDVFRIEREGFRRATHIFAVSRYTAGIIERLYGVNRRKISVAYNAPEHTETSVIASPDAPRAPQVVFLGRLTFQKGPDHFLRAASLVAQADPKAKFIFCGTGDMMDKLKWQAHQLGLDDRVHFAGFVDPAGVDEILKRSKVLVMPSVSEPFGLVALEAIRCGIPVILSKQSGVREVLHRALQVDFWDHDKLADQMLAALRLPDLSRQLVYDGMDQVSQLSWDKSAQKIIDQYYQHLGSTYAQAIRGAHGH